MLNERNGVSNLFMLFASPGPVTDRRTKVWARHEAVGGRGLPGQRTDRAGDGQRTPIIRPREAFEPEARRIAERLEIHYTPKPEPEIEIGVLARQCLDRRIPDQETLRREVDAWQDQRNRDMARVDWRFTTEDARIKLKSLYPAIQNS